MIRRAALLLAACLLWAGGCYYNPMSLPCINYNPWPGPGRSLLPTEPPADQWQLLGETDLARVYVNKTLYALPDLRPQANQITREVQLATQPMLAYENPRHYLAFRVQNLTHREIDVDLNDYWDVIHPAQWAVGGSIQQAPTTRPAPPDQFTPPDRQRMLQEFYANSLIRIPPLASVDYYRDFQAPHQTAVTPLEGEKFVVQFRGRILVTDGRKVEAVVCPPGAAQCRMEMPLPAPYDAVPMGALLVRREGAEVLLPVSTAIMWPSEQMPPQLAPPAAPVPGRTPYEIPGLPGSR